MRFGKLENGNLILFKPPIKTGTKDIFTNDPDILLEYGYKIVELTAHETIDGKYPVPYWDENETSIIQKWNYEDIESGEEELTNGDN